MTAEIAFDVASLHAAYATGLSPGEVMSRLNATLARRLPLNCLITLFYGVLDPREHVLTYANAGHNPPMLVHPIGTWRYLDDSDLILGVDPTTIYKEHAIHLSEGDMLVLYTDGVTDEPNAND